jgi:hypothetical protein
MIAKKAVTWGWPSNNGLQLLALRATAKTRRYADQSL